MSLGGPDRAATALLSRTRFDGVVAFLLAAVAIETVGGPAEDDRGGTPNSPMGQRSIGEEEIGGYIHVGGESPDGEDGGEHGKRREQYGRRQRKTLILRPVPLDPSTMTHLQSYPHGSTKRIV